MDQSKLPNIPGFRVNVDLRDRFHKSHIFDVRNGIPVTDLKHVSVSAADLEKLQTENTNSINKDQAPKHEIPLTTLPRWVVYDRKVLRFYAYFSEPVHNSNIEHMRVRQCCIYWYLENDTLSITEIKEVNSGIPQGPFLRRSRMKKPNGEFLELQDIKVGGDVVINRRTFHVIDADKTTRAFYEENIGEVLADPIPVPADDYRKYLAQVQEYRDAAPKENDVTNYVESMLGRSMGWQLAKVRKFLANDRKVLRFWGVWDDPELYGEKRHYELQYFLADDTIQVLERHNNNSGRDPFPALLTRCKLPKEYVPAGVVFGGGPSSGPTDESQYYSHADIRVGGFVNVYGRQVLITKADPYTVSFYKEVHGLSDDDFKEVVQKEKKNVIPKQEPPPYTGFGTEEDSLGSWYQLVPRPPRKNHARLMKYDKVALRFLAKFDTDEPENAERRFVIEFYLADNTTKIYERPIRNSGFVGGLFLERNRVRNGTSGDWLHAEDFFVGAILNINGFKFLLLECDKQTEAVFHDDIEVFTRQTPQQILRGLADKLWDRSYDKRETFRMIDTDRDHTIGKEELKKICNTYGWTLNPNQVNAVFNFFDNNHNGRIEASEFFRALEAFKLDRPASIPQIANTKSYPVGEINISEVVDEAEQEEQEEQ